MVMVHRLPWNIWGASLSPRVLLSTHQCHGQPTWMCLLMLTTFWEHNFQHFCRWLFLEMAPGYSRHGWWVDYWTPSCQSPLLCMILRRFMVSMLWIAVWGWLGHWEDSDTYCAGALFCLYTCPVLLFHVSSLFPPLILCVGITQYGLYLVLDPWILQ